MNDTIATIYRVLATTTTGFANPLVDITIKWQGSDTDELSLAYPPSDILFADPLFQKELEGGFIITRFTFEQQLTDGSWEQIDDPRRRLTPITAYEQAIDAENRRDFPGDYITYCEDCGYDDCRCDDYRVDCTSCNDHGCAKCDPSWCTSCNDHGCAKCDPSWCTACDNNGCAICDSGNVCKSCKHYCDPQYESLSNVSGLCQGCEYFAKLCDQCGQADHDGQDRLCGDCRSINEYDAAHKCNNCYDAVVANVGDNCPSCQAFLDSQCISCQQDVANGDNKLCSDCREYYSDQEKYYVWWRRALRACKFWR